MVIQDVYGEQVGKKYARMKYKFCGYYWEANFMAI